MPPSTPPTLEVLNSLAAPAKHSFFPIERCNLFAAKEDRHPVRALINDELPTPTLPIVAVQNVDLFGSVGSPVGENWRVEVGAPTLRDHKRMAVGGATFHDKNFSPQEDVRRPPKV